MEGADSDTQEQQPQRESREQLRARQAADHADSDRICAASHPVQELQWLNEFGGQRAENERRAVEAAARAAEAAERKRKAKHRAEEAAERAADASARQLVRVETPRSQMSNITAWAAPMAPSFVPQPQLEIDEPASWAMQHTSPVCNGTHPRVSVTPVSAPSILTQPTQPTSTPSISASPAFAQPLATRPIAAWMQSPRSESSRPGMQPAQQSAQQPAQPSSSANIRQSNQPKTAETTLENTSTNQTADTFTPRTSQPSMSTQPQTRPLSTSPIIKQRIMGILWVSKLDPKSGNRFYFTATEKRPQWTPPSGWQSSSTAKIHAAQSVDQLPAQPQSVDQLPAQPQSVDQLPAQPQIPACKLRAALAASQRASRMLDQAKQQCIQAKKTIHDTKQQDLENLSTVMDAIFDEMQESDGASVMTPVRLLAGDSLELAATVPSGVLRRRVPYCDMALQWAERSDPSGDSCELKLTELSVEAVRAVARWACSAAFPDVDDELKLWQLWSAGRYLGVEILEEHCVQLLGGRRCEAP